MRIAFASFAVAVAAGCIPARDNPSDPAVAPRARMVVRVGDAPMSVGGRFADWQLDGAESEAPHGIASWTWRLSSVSASDPAEIADADWLAAGSGELVTTSSGNGELGSALAQIIDFDEAPGQQPLGVVERWIHLELEDDDGRTDDAYQKITVLNQAPAVELGPDRRVAPGGAWWRVSTKDLDGTPGPDGDTNGDGHADPLDAAQRIVTIHAGLTDPDDGDADSLELRWYVVGAMAPLLSTSASGIVHSDFLDTGGRRLTFDASLMPSRSSFRVEVLEGAAVVAADTVNVDVGTSRWSTDRTNGSLRRLPAPRLQRRLGGDLDRLLATRPGRLLFARQTGGGVADLDVLGLDLSVVASRFQPVAATNLSALSAVATEGTGWWVSDTQGGALHHFGTGTTLPPTGTPITDVDSDGSDDAANIAGMAPVHGGGQEDVWVLIPPLAIRRSPTAVLDSVDTGALASSRIVEDGTGGFWVSWAAGGSAIIRHYDAAGTLVSDETEDFGISVFGVRSLSYDPQRNQLFGTIATAIAGFTFVRKPSGSYDLSDFDGSTSHVDVADGSLVVFGQGKLRRFTADFVPANDLVLDKFLSNFALVDGSLLVHGFDTTTTPFPQFATWIEGGKDDLGVEIPDAYVEGSSTVAVDPANGSAWIWDKAMGSLREMGPDGAELRVLSFDGSNGAGPGVDVVVGIDPGPPEGPRRVWLGWSDESAGGLQYFDLTDDRSVALVPVATSFSGPTMITSIAPLAEGDGVCVGGLVVGDFMAPFVTGWVFRPSTSATIPLSFPVSNPSIAIADVPRQACWFIPDHQQDFTAESAFVPVDGVSPSTAFSTTVAGQVRIFTGGLIDHWYNGIPGYQGRMFFMTRSSFQAGFPTRVLSIYEPTLSTAPLLGPAFSLAFPGPYDECESVAYDPFYRQFLIGMGDAGLPSSVEPTILWVSSTGFSESAQAEGLYSPSLAGP